MLHPLTKIPPSETASSPVIILKVVVFPAPFKPSKPKHSPRGTPKVIPSTARNRDPEKGTKIAKKNADNKRDEKTMIIWFN